MSATDDGELRVVTTTGLLADMVRQVAGDRATVSQLVPNGADPHSHEPSLRAIRDVAWADLAFSNYLMLEEHAVIRALDANLPVTSTSVSIAEEAAKQGATILPLVENRGLDALWLGMRVAGTATDRGATRASQVDLVFTGVDGPGAASSFLTTTFGTPEIAFSSHDAFDAARGYEGDTATLPADAHQHMSWAFTKPGLYRVHLHAALRIRQGERPQRLPETTLTFAVGIDPHDVASREGRRVLSVGHADLTADLEAWRLTLMVENAALATDHEAGAPTPVAGAAEVAGLTSLDPAEVVIEVPARTLTEVPAAPGHRFLGHAGDPVHLLPQAVLGKHVHGEIDPHLWHDAHNAAAYVKVIRDHLIEVDPVGEETYRTRAAAYLDELERVDAQMQAAVDSIPPQRRHLVTTTDAFAYLAKAYGLSVAGFVAPHPGVEPSLADRRKLAATLDSLDVPAVFLEPQMNQRRSPLVSVAEQSHVAICPLYGDTLDHEVTTYVDLMRFNAASLARCLGGGTTAPGGSG